MRIHREGITTLLILALVIGALTYMLSLILPIPSLALIPGVLGFIWFLQFFRNPVRVIPALDEHSVYAPADGKVVVIEEVEEPHYFKDRRIQVSIFMSPYNVHVNRNPVSGKVVHTQYDPGKYLVAWHPKSSTENERNTVVYEIGSHRILVRQIAGAVARRIKCYVQENQFVEQGTEMGFIKFGSRVDLFLPLDAEMMVSIGDAVKGNLNLIAKLPAR